MPKDTPLQLTLSKNCNVVICQHFIDNLDSFSNSYDFMKLVMNSHDEVIKLLEYTVIRTKWEEFEAFEGSGQKLDFGKIKETVYPSTPIG